MKLLFCINFMIKNPDEIFFFNGHLFFICCRCQKHFGWKNWPTWGIGHDEYDRDDNDDNGGSEHDYNVMKISTFLFWAGWHLKDLPYTFIVTTSWAVVVALWWNNNWHRENVFLMLWRGQKDPTQANCNWPCLVWTNLFIIFLQKMHLVLAQLFLMICRSFYWNAKRWMNHVD